MTTNVGPHVSCRYLVVPEAYLDSVLLMFGHGYSALRRRLRPGNMGPNSIPIPSWGSFIVINTV